MDLIKTLQILLFWNQLGIFDRQTEGQTDRWMDGWMFVSKVRWEREREREREREKEKWIVFHSKQKYLLGGQCSSMEAHWLLVQIPLGEKKFPLFLYLITQIIIWILTQKWPNFIWYSVEGYSKFASIFVLSLNTSTWNHHIFALPTIRHRYQSFGICLNDKSENGTPLCRNLLAFNRIE